MADVKVKSGASSDQLTVDATSKAMRIIRLRPDGSFANKVPAGVYMLPISSTNTGGGSTQGIWAMRNGPSATVSLYIRQVYIRTCFNAVAVAASDGIWVSRFSGAAYTGGTALTPIKLQSVFTSSQVSDARQDTTGAGLGATSVVVGNQFAIAFRNANPGTSFGLKLKLYDANDPDGMIKIAPGEGLVITTEPRTGHSVGGFVMWEERT